MTPSFLFPEPLPMKISSDVLALCMYLHLYVPLITFNAINKKKLMLSREKTILSPIKQVLSTQANLQPLSLLQIMWPLSWEAAMSQKWLNIFRASAPCYQHPDPQGHLRLTRHCCQNHVDCLRGCSLWQVSTCNVVITEHYICSQIWKIMQILILIFTQKKVFPAKNVKQKKTGQFNFTFFYFTSWNASH